MNVKAVTTAGNVTAASTKKATGSNTSFTSYLGETKELDAIFEEASKKYGVDVKVLKAIAKAESDFNPNSTSHCGAMGIMQLMPATAKELGVTNAYDPRQNIMGGAKLISNLLDKYDGDLSLALAGYNAGPGNVRKYGGVPPFKETQNYIKKVKGYLGTTTTGTSSSTTVVTNSTKPQSLAANGRVEEAKGTTVIPSGLQLKRRAAESSMETAAARTVTATSTDSIALMLYQLQEGAKAADAEEVFAQEEYFKFIEQFYVEDESKVSDAELARRQMMASIAGAVKNI